MYQLAFPFLITALFQAAVCVAAVTTPACSKQPYKDLSVALATYTPAQKYCSSKYPISTVTTTTTITQSGFVKRTAMPLEQRGAAKGNDAKCSSNLSKFTRSAFANAVSTFCSCIETTPTTTLTSTVTDLGVTPCNPTDAGAALENDGNDRYHSGDCENCFCQADADGTSAYCALQSRNAGAECSKDADCLYGNFCELRYGFPRCYPGNGCMVYVPSGN